ncbi:TonB family protein [Archangium violaceum]|uniref:TonB family protein n=1 Tax=Archangium violaceum TaxID=83451 RepID=UPI00193C4F3B|nr:TonB family protein [Archangium violaceum]QRK09481.1 TonB family protein [Archangium violaceum]
METQPRPPNTDEPAPPPPSEDPLLGRTLLGRFLVQAPIGEGGMGRVYRALQVPLDRVVALKILSPTFPTSKDPGFLQRFIREASLTAKLRSPNTVTVIDYGQTEDGICFIAMEYIEGRTLSEVLAEGPLPWPRAMELARQVCFSLREAHRLGVVHRDLKPANVMLVADGDRDHVKVLDFGLVKPFSPEGAGAEATPAITQSGTFLGSPVYMSPEQARNVADVRSDIYSLGVVTYHMLMGRPPFVSKDTLELLFAHHKVSPPRFRDLQPGLVIPERVEALVLRCLEKDPQARYASMDELLEALREVLGRVGDSSPISSPFLTPLPAPPAQGPEAGTLVLDISLDVPPASGAQRPSAPVQPPAPPRRTNPWMGVALAVLLVGAGAGVALWRRPEPVPTSPPAPTPVAEAPAPAPAPVRFFITSEPSGARVFWLGQERGSTPLVLDVPPGSNGVATAELTFVLDGYQTESALAGGSGDVLFTQRLRKQPASRVAQVSGSSARQGAAYAGAVADFSTPEMLASERPPAQVQRPALVEKPARPVGPIQLPEKATAPRELASNVQPEFPQSARASGREGLVILKIIVTEDGRVGDISVMRGEEPFASSAIAAVRTWRYSPALLDGRPISVYRVVKIPFRLR